MLYICARHRDTKLWNTFVSNAGLPDSEWERYAIEADTPDEALHHARRIARAMHLLDDDTQQLMLALTLETQQWRALNDSLPEGLCIQVPAAWDTALGTLVTRQLVTMVDAESREVRLKGAIRHYRPSLPTATTMAA